MVLQVLQPCVFVIWGQGPRQEKGGVVLPAPFRIKLTGVSWPHAPGTCLLRPSLTGPEGPLGPSL